MTYVFTRDNLFQNIERSSDTIILSFSQFHIPDSKVHGANIGPTWVLSAPDGPHVGPMNLVIWDLIRFALTGFNQLTCDNNDLVPEAAVIRHYVRKGRIVKKGMHDVEAKVTMMVSSGKSPSYNWILQPVSWGQMWSSGRTCTVATLLNGRGTRIGGIWSRSRRILCRAISLIARFMGPTRAHLGPTGPRRALCWPHEFC